MSTRFYILEIVFELHFKSQTSEETIITETTDGKYVTIGTEEIFKPEGDVNVNLSKGCNCSRLNIIRKNIQRSCIFAEGFCAKICPFSLFFLATF